MWRFIQPAEIRFGCGEALKMPDILKSLGMEDKKGIIVSSASFVKNGTAEKLAELCGIDHIFSGISQNPDVSEADRCADRIREIKAEYIIAIGGGSVIDCAKAASVVCLTDKPTAHFHGAKAPLPNEHIPVIAVPTTAGTGSEVTGVSVLTNRRTGLKAPIGGTCLYPVCAVIDPELTYSVPKHITANTGMDVLCHAVEGYWSTGHQPICDALAERAAGLVFENLVKLYEYPQDKNAREKMCEASVLAGLAFALPKTTSSHACSFPLTNDYGIPHGEACALTLDSFMRINASQDDGRLLDFANHLGFSTVEQMADKVYEMKIKMNMRVDLKDLHLSKEAVGRLVKACRSPNLLNNPVAVTDEMLYCMFETML